VPQYFHVSSSRNRESILRHGLDWTRMGAARGIAGADRPEVHGVFLCQSAFDVEFLLRFDATDLPLDVWAVEGVDEDELVEAPEGFVYVPRPISPQQLTLVRRDESPGDSGEPSRDVWRLHSLEG